MTKEAHKPNEVLARIQDKPCSADEVLAGWYANTPMQLVDVSEFFVGIGQTLINGHSLFAYIEEVYEVRSSLLPFVLLREICTEIAHGLRTAGLTGGFLVFFRDLDSGGAPGLCMREVSAVLQMENVLREVWFDSEADPDFALFLKKEHICIAVGYRDAQSLHFLNAALGMALYAAVLDITTFRPPRVFMFVLSPSKYCPEARYAARERGVARTEKTRKKTSAEEALGIIQKALLLSFPAEKVEHMQRILGSAEAFSYYPSIHAGAEQDKTKTDRTAGSNLNALAPLGQELTAQIFRAVAECREPPSLSAVVDGVILHTSGKKPAAIPNVLGGPTQRAAVRPKFVPTKIRSATFYNEEQAKTFRSEQMYTESLKKTAQSLHEGKHLHNPIKLVTDGQKRKKKDAKEKHSGNPGNSRASRSPAEPEPRKLSRKEQEIIDRNKKQKEEEAKKKDVAYLRSFFAKYSAYATNYEKRKHLESFPSRIHSPFVCAKILLLQIEFYSSQWTLEKRKKKPNEGDLVSIYLACSALIEKYHAVATYAEMQYAAQTLIDLGFVSTALELLGKYGIRYANHSEQNGKTAQGEKGSPEDTSGHKDALLLLKYAPESTAEPNDFDLSFLMRAAGDKLKRTLNSRPDPRLLFEPDEWQVQLLDVVQDNESAVICAPTSSGKTFICYYAMENILRNSNEDVVIYVSPTKALVNQVAADVYARFGSKPYIKQSNILQGICMNDFQISPFNCQVLITVPDVLEKVLTMPPEAKKKECPYLSRVKYIIVDEVHKISDSKMGGSMEKIIHFSPCPIILLSATLGNLPEFYRWVRSIEERKGRKCKLVEHKERYCEIKNYVFVPKPIEKLETCHKTTRAPDELALAAINSLFAYSLRDIKDKGFSDDVNFLPEELLNLYYAIFAVLRREQRGLVKKLRPQRFFKTNCITKKDVKEYEKYMITEFREMMVSGKLDEEQVSNIYDILVKDAKEGFQKIEQGLQTEMSNTLAFQSTVGSLRSLSISAKREEGTKREESAKGEDIPQKSNCSAQSAPVSSDILLYNTDYLLDGILDLIVELDAKGMLPCIVFNLERTVCNALAARLVAELERHERQAGPSVSKTDVRESEKLLKEMKRARDSAPATSKDAWIGESMIAEEVATRQMNLSARDARFCFTDPAITSSGTYVFDEHARILKKTGKVDGKLIEALYRGIGVHHTGTPKKYRNAVEILFRTKQLRVVFATETLALGINMPCRTAVFAGDSLSLDSMSFKQMAGRAGRRGYDTQGNVVFFGVPKQKVQSLITSYLPWIKGEYPYTNTLAVQMARPTAMEKTLESFVFSPLMSLSPPSLFLQGLSETKRVAWTQSVLSEQRRHLAEKGFLMQTQPGEAKSVSHISSLSDLPTEHTSFDPESFILMALFNEGVFGALCDKADKETSSERIVHLLASIFEVCILPVRSKAPALPPLPEQIQERIDAYAREGLEKACLYLGPRERELLRVLGGANWQPVHARSFFVSGCSRRQKSSYIMDYYKNCNVKHVLESTGMGETLLFIHLKGISDILEMLSVFCRMYHPESIVTQHIVSAQITYLEKFKKMHA